MAHGEFQLNNLDDLKSFVYETLCQQESLVSGAFRMSEQILVRGGRACGMHFCLHGPRAVMVTAIWDLRAGTILFYNSAGERFLTTRLLATVELAMPELEAVAA